MPIIFALILIAGLIMLARSALFWLYFIQTKHYRLDRLWLEIRKKSFWRLVFSSHRIIVLVFVLGWFAIFRSRAHFSFAIAWDLVILSYLILYVIKTVIHTLYRQLKVPQFTPRILVLFIPVFLVELSIILIYQTTFFPLTLEFLQPVIVFSVFSLAYTPNIFLHRYFISRAKEKIAAHKNLVVIGITGSYGKTTTKEFLAHILSKKFSVLKTPARINVDTGVAKVILRELKPEHEIFIVEMGAYKRGEIKKICDLVQPQYAVLTGLSDQHLELFGSLQAIADAKFELVESVGQSNKIFANEDSAELVSEFKRRAIMPTWYGLRGHASRFKVSDLRLNEDSTEFKLHGVNFRVPTIGTAALNNLLGAITVAIERGMHLDDLPAMLQDLPKLSGTMQPAVGPNGALLIDDTYNANTEGVVTALADLARFKRARKILVFSEVIELGERADEDHAAIAQAAAKSATHAFLLPSRMLHAMRSQLIERGYEAAQIIRDTDELKKLLDADTVVLFEGRDAAKILAQIIG